MPLSLIVIGGLQPISSDTDNNAAMFIAGGRTKAANEKSFVSPLSSIVNDQVCYSRSLSFEAAFIGESEKQDNYIIEGSVRSQILYGSPESFLRESAFTAALQAEGCCYRL